MNDAAIAHVLRELESVKRRLDNMIVPGKVVALSDDKKRIKVKHGSCETPFIRWFAPSAGAVIEYRAPSVGESVILINLTGGDDTSCYQALCGLESDSFQFPTNNPDVHRRKYPDGTIVEYDHKNSVLNIVMQQGTANITAPDAVTIDTNVVTCTNNLIVEGETNLIGNVACNSNVDVDGNVAADGQVSDGTSTMQVMRDKFNVHGHGNNVAPPSANRMI